MQDITENDKRYYEAVTLLGGRLSSILKKVGSEHAAKICEVRLRSGQPITLYKGQSPLFLEENGELIEKPFSGMVIATKIDLFESFRALCAYSIHTHQNEIADGYISLTGGHRAGICGIFGGEAGKMNIVRDILSINLRVARQVRGIACPLVKTVFNDGICGVLIAGPPGSGKTTLLRDIARTLSSGENGSYYKVCVVDERGELGAASQGVIQNDLGICTDLLSGYPKALGIEIAVRTLSPHVIICDEIGRQDELEAVKSGLFSAVHIITSVHCSKKSQLTMRPQARALLETGAFQKIVMLSCNPLPCTVEDIIDIDEMEQKLCVHSFN